MSFIASLHKAVSKVDPVTRNFDPAYSLLAPKTPPAPPGVPNPNDAANAAQSTTDSMRMRRGLLSNIYAGAGTQQPNVGKTTLGS